MPDPESPKQEEKDREGAPKPDQAATSAGPAASPALLAVLAVVVLWAFFFVLGLEGLEFGTHWDENRLLHSISRAIGTGSLRPTFYVYPAVTHWLVWLPALPSLLAGFPAAKQCLASVDPGEPTAWTPCLAHWTTHALESLAPAVVILRARVLFLLVSSATVVLAGLAIFRERRRAGEAAIAAAVVATSWEVQYHARWTAPDTLLMTAAALVLWTLVEAERRSSARWLSAAAVAAAFGASTKLTGGILLLPVILAGATQAREGRRIPALDVRRAARLGVTFAIAFCLISPGAIVDAPQVVLEILHESRHYATGHGVYTVSPGVGHLWSMIAYLFGPLLSPRWPLGYVLGALAVAGGVAAFREGSRALQAFIVTALVFVIFLATRRVMIVRNLIWITPILAVCAARGVTFLAEAITARRPSMSLDFVPATVAAVVLLLGAASTADAAARVTERQLDGQPARAVAALNEHAGSRVFLTSEARARFAAAGAPIPPNVALRIEEAEYVMGLFSELPGEGIRANARGTFALGLTAPEVNLDYYPTSLDRERFVALRKATWEAAMATMPRPQVP